MVRRTLDSRPTVRSEGGLLPPELLDRITDPREKDLPGLDPSRDYGLEPNVRTPNALPTFCAPPAGLDLVFM